MLVDDYGHHPAEMAATLAAARGAFPERRILLAFQPHRYTRTRDCFEDFVKVLSTADALVLTEVYPAGEAPIVAADGKALARAIRVQGKVEPIFVEKVADLPAAILAAARDGDVVLTMGAGSDRQRAGGAGERPAEKRERRSMNMVETGDLAAAGLRGELKRREPMARHVSWRAGGAARTAYFPADLDDLIAFLRSLPAAEPVLMTGLGSNLLVRDGGLRGTVIFTQRALREVRLDHLGVLGGGIYAEAGVASPKVARFAALNELAGAEFLAGIPGTVGGALAMNAGCYGGETWNIVAHVHTVDRAGKRRVRTPDEYAIDYRHVRLKACRRKHEGRIVCHPAEEWFLAAVFNLKRGSGAESRAKITELLKRRIAAQPLNEPNAGSVFRNPQGDYAARLIEACGLKGRAIGGAMISDKHANFIVNRGAARGADIEALILLAERSVQEKFGVALEREVRIVGEA